VNPAVFACVTFPFLFGVMFGDLAHGGVLLLVGSMLCLFSDRLKVMGAGNSVMMGIIQLRYIFMLMGFFATYCGLIYNDLFAVPLWLFDSCYPLKYLPMEEESDDPNAKE
jgi:V-type H+-transporting ATPase subunit a